MAQSALLGGSCSCNYWEIPQELQEVKLESGASRRLPWRAVIDVSLFHYGVPGSAAHSRGDGAPPTRISIAAQCQLAEFARHQHRRKSEGRRAADLSHPVSRRQLRHMLCCQFTVACILPAYMLDQDVFFLTHFWSEKHLI